ncbi:hypothetical protein SLA2020_344390 [Shorea laevis]
MGGVISNAANGIGNALGNLFTAPFKTIFGASCQDVCSGPWDVICFIEHLCVANLVKLFLILGLCFLILMFFYLLFKLGICQCIVKGLFKVCWAGCETYWFTLKDITCFLWYKLKNTKRVNRRRRRRPSRDIEVGYCSSSNESDCSDNYHLGVSRKRNRARKRHQWRSSGHHKHHVKLKTRDVSLHLKSGSRRLRNSQRLKITKVRNPTREMRVAKRRRIRR